MSVLEVKNLEKHFDRTKVLNDISFTLEQGQALSIIGSSGSRKSRSYVRNRVFQAVVRRESLIITDCKGEIYEMADYLRTHGYTIRVFNLVNPECSDSWDCLGEIHGDDLMAQIFADVVIQNSNNGRSDRFWDDAEQNLFKALLLYVDQEYSAGQRTLAAVYDLLTGAGGTAQQAHPRPQGLRRRLAKRHPDPQGRLPLAAGHYGTG